VVAGMRNLLQRSEFVRNFATSGIAHELAAKLLGCQPLPVRGILFDKTPGANWYVTWHQDLSIPVSGRVDIDGYGPWSIKDGIDHVQPPAAILENMVSLRIHLDACGERNGPIMFIAGSHLSGVLEPADISRWRDGHAPVTCQAERGDVLAMRPLTLHSSAMAESTEHRRVLHLEYSGANLPEGLEWAQA